jgi:hypothetical protein
MGVDDKDTGGCKTTAQREILVERQKMHYEGLFNVADLYRTIDEYYEEKGYDKREIKNAEIVRDDGIRYIEIIFAPWKKITDYAKVIIKTRMIMENVKQVEIEKEDLKIKANEGKVLFQFSVFLDTDYEDKWASSPLQTFFRIIFDKFFFKKYTERYQAEAMDDFKMLVWQIRTLLNMNKM